MKTKTNKSIAMSGNREADLARLNELYAKYCRAHDRLMAEYDKAFADMDDRFCGKRKATNLASAQFNLLRKRLPRTKFDMISGKYFYAEENGKEVFAVKVSREQSCIVYVTAKNAGEAIKTATAIVKADMKLLEDKGLHAEDVSR